MDAHQARMEEVKADMQSPRVSREMARMVREYVGIQRRCDMPSGTSDEWYKAIYALVDEGYLKMEHGTHVCRVKPTESPAAEVKAEVKESKPVQGMLF